MVLVSGQQSKTLSFGTQSNSIMKYIRWFSYSEEAISLTRSFSLIHTQPRSMGLWAHTFDGIYKTLNLGKFPWFSKEPKIKPLDLEPTGTTSAENKPNFQISKFPNLAILLRSCWGPTLCQELEFYFFSFWSSKKLNSILIKQKKLSGSFSKSLVPSFCCPQQLEQIRARIGLKVFGSSKQSILKKMLFTFLIFKAVCASIFFRQYKKAKVRNKNLPSSSYIEIITDIYSKIFLSKYIHTTIHTGDEGKMALE